MAPRNSELPEGTDHIISGAMETGAGTGASTGSSGGSGGGLGGSSTGNPGSSSSGTSGGTFMASSNGDDTGGTSTGGGSGRGAGEKLASGVRGQVSSLTDQATAKAREYADSGKERATSALDNFAEVINEAARSIDERLGSQYGEYAHKAAGAVTSLSENLRGKSVDELLEDGRSAVRKSPGIAIGTAAVLGFALIRLVKAGLDDSEREVSFRPDQGRNVEFKPDNGGAGAGGSR
jgi:hypothetical protein